MPRSFEEFCKYEHFKIENETDRNRAIQNYRYYLFGCREGYDDCLYDDRNLNMEEISDKSYKYGRFKLQKGYDSIPETNYNPIKNTIELIIKGFAESIKN